MNGKKAKVLWLLTLIAWIIVVSAFILVVTNQPKEMMPITGMVTAAPVCESAPNITYNITYNYTYNITYLVDAPYLDITRKIAMEHKYRTGRYGDIYDCTDFSADTRNALRDAGWAANIDRSYVNCSAGLVSCPNGNNHHQFVVLKVVIEATSGEIVTPDMYDNYGIDRDAL